MSSMEKWEIFLISDYMICNPEMCDPLNGINMKTFHHRSHNKHHCDIQALKKTQKSNSFERKTKVIGGRA